MHQMSNIQNRLLKDKDSNIASTSAKSNTIILIIHFPSPYLYPILLMNKYIANLLAGERIHNEFNQDNIVQDLWLCT